MRKLFLTSGDLNALPKFLGKPLKGLKVAFIPTAANTYPADHRWWLEQDRQFYKDNGAELIEADINGKSREELEEIFRGIDVLHFGGGNTFYLLEKARESGLDRIVERLLGKGVVYVGSSAGACLAAPDIEPISLADDRAAAPNLKSTKSLGLVDFLVVPHFDAKQYDEENKAIMKKYSANFKFVPLNNDQAILVEGKNYKIVKSGVS